MKNIGSPGVQSSERLTTSTSNGQVREATYTGTEQFIRSVYSAYLAAGYECSCDIKPGLCSITIKDANEAVLEQSTIGIEVEMQTTKLHKSIFEPPGPSGLSLSSDQLAIIKRALATNDADDILDVVALGSDAQDLFDLALAGVEHRTVWQPILTKVTTAGRTFEFSSHAHDWIGYNYSEAAMLQELSVLLTFPIPVFTTPLPSGFSYGWVKQMPHYTQVVGQRVSETIQFEFGAWADLLYPLRG